MNLKCVAFVWLMAISFSHTSIAEVQSKATVGPKSIVGWRMHYADNFADYIYRFQKDGKYFLVFVSKSPEAVEGEKRTGKYTFKRTSKSGAKLQIDGDEWTLNFDKINRAKGQMKGDLRDFMLYFEDPN